MRVKSHFRSVKAAILICIYALTLPAIAGDLNYDAKEQQKMAVFNELNWRAHSCMSQGARRLLAQGVRDSATIAEYLEKNCGGELLAYMTMTMKRPEIEVRGFIKVMAYDELNDVPGLTRSIPVVSEEKLEFGKPAILNGIFNIGTFENCCAAGKGTKQKYYFIQLKKKTEVISQINDETEPTMQSVEVIQLGGVATTNFRKISKGTKITASCKDLWYGSNGHYALPVYCTDANIKLAPE